MIRIASDGSELSDIIQRMDSLRESAIHQGRLRQNDSEEYLHQAYRLAGLLDPVMASDKKIRHAAGAIVKKMGEDSIYRRYDPLQKDFWNRHDDDFQEAFENLAIGFFREDFRKMSQGYHLLQAIKYLDLYKASPDKKKAVISTIVPAHGAGHTILYKDKERLTEDRIEHGSIAIVCDDNREHNILNPHRYEREMISHSLDNLTIVQRMKIRGTRLNINTITELKDHYKRFGFSKLRLIIADEMMPDHVLKPHKEHLEGKDGNDLILGIPLIPEDTKDHFDGIDALAKRYGAGMAEKLLFSVIYKRVFCEKNLKNDCDDIWRERLEVAKAFDENREFLTGVHSPESRKTNFHVSIRDGYEHVTYFAFEHDKGFVLSCRMRKDHYFLEFNGDTLEKRMKNLSKNNSVIFMKGRSFTGKQLTGKGIYTRLDGLMLESNSS